MLARANVSCCVPPPGGYRRRGANPNPNPTQPANGAGQARGRGGGNVTFPWGSVGRTAPPGTTAVAPQHPLGPINGVHLMILNTAKRLNRHIIKPPVMF